MFVTGSGVWFVPASMNCARRGYASVRRELPATETVGLASRRACQSPSKRHTAAVGSGDVQLCAVGPNACENAPNGDGKSPLANGLPSLGWLTFAC